MDAKVVESKVRLVKYQVYLGEKLQESLRRYMQDTYGSNTRVKTAVFRRAIAEFLRREGYYGEANRNAERTDGPCSP